MKNSRDLAKPLRHFVGITFSIIIFLTLLQVFCRFVLNSPLTWSESISRFLFIWMIMIGAAILCFDNALLRISGFIENRSVLFQFILTTIFRLVQLTFLIATSVTSIKLVKIAHKGTMVEAGIPMSYWRASATVGCLVIAIYEIFRLILDIKALRQGEFTISNDSSFDEEEENR